MEAGSVSAGVVTFDGEVFAWSQEAGSWHFVRVPAEASAAVVELLVGPRRGFGSVRVAATVGSTTWETSLFPDKESGGFLLPVKKSVRTAEGILADDVVHVELVVEPGTEGAES